MSRELFHAEHQKCYNKAKANGWLDEITAHMPIKKTAHSFDEILDFAKQCKTKGEFINRYEHLYTYARKHGWINEIYTLSHLIEKQEDCIKKYADLCKRYNEKQRFMREQKSAVAFLRKNNLLEKYTAHMVDNRACTNPKYYNKDYLRVVALKYYTKSALKKDHPTEYRYIIKNHWENELFEHMNKAQALTNLKTDEELMLLVEQKKDMSQFLKSGCLVIALKKRDLYDKAISLIHSRAIKRAINKNEQKQAECNQLVSTCKSRVEFMRKYPSKYNYLRQHGLLEKILGCFPKQPHKSHTFEECRAIAKKFTYRKDFSNSFPNVYKYALKYGWIDEICSHMPKNKLIYDAYKSEQECAELAKQYRTRSEFQKKNSALYSYIQRNYDIDKICPHLIQRNNISML